MKFVLPVITLIVVLTVVSTSFQTLAQEDTSKPEIKYDTLVTCFPDSQRAVVKTSEKFYLMFPVKRGVTCEFNIEGPIMITQKHKLLSRGVLGEPIVPMNTYMYIFKPTGSGEAKIKRTGIVTDSGKRISTDKDLFTITIKKDTDEEAK